MRARFLLQFLWSVSDDSDNDDGEENGDGEKDNGVEESADTLVHD